MALKPLVQAVFKEHTLKTIGRRGSQAGVDPPSITVEKSRSSLSSPGKLFLTVVQTTAASSRKFPCVNTIRIRLVLEHFCLQHTVNSHVDAA